MTIAEHDRTLPYVSIRGVTDFRTTGRGGGPVGRSTPVPGRNGSAKELHVDSRVLPPQQPGGLALESWLRRLCALAVVTVAANASYVHQREFAVQAGADEVSAALWPLSVEPLAHRQDGGGPPVGDEAEARGQASGSERQRGDPLLDQARRLEAQMSRPRGPDSKVV
ncbi:DUF2637 domain-containing protein [Streptomyces sp. NPDC127108]|uniref:DUF2637 domain-containing protein n=1 Tax=Streptomyces sp. NPDC127108 TaxID=3345361 RepID=UPI003640816D